MVLEKRVAVTFLERRVLASVTHPPHCCSQTQPEGDLGGQGCEPQNPSLAYEATVQWVTPAVRKQEAEGWWVLPHILLQ